MQTETLNNKIMDTCLEQEASTEKIDPLSDGISSVELVRVSGSDLDIANAARVSYGRISKEISERDKTLIKFLMQHNHTSPFEHNQFSFRIKAPIFVTRQWMRHRMNSYNEISYRYVKVSTEFYVPQTWRLQDEQNKQSSFGAFNSEELSNVYKETMDTCWKTYNTLLEAGVCREQARAVLPVATYTEFIFTCNLHSLMHFLKLRLGHGAQSEIRDYAKALFKLALPHFPISLHEWAAVNLPDQEWQSQIKEWTNQLG
ncbi:FAD-dependent thymidylate synthase [bacterium]|nr:FAD-dependent thymidylate synthase [bacterium]